MTTEKAILDLVTVIYWRDPTKERKIVGLEKGLNKAAGCLLVFVAIGVGFASLHPIFFEEVSDILTLTEKKATISFCHFNTKKIVQVTHVFRGMFSM